MKNLELEVMKNKIKKTIEKREVVKSYKSTSNFNLYLKKINELIEKCSNVDGIEDYLNELEDLSKYVESICNLMDSINLLKSDLEEETLNLEDEEIEDAEIIFSKMSERYTLLKNEVKSYDIESLNNLFEEKIELNFEGLETEINFLRRYEEKNERDSLKETEIIIDESDVDCEWSDIDFLVSDIHILSEDIKELEHKVDSVEEDICELERRLKIYEKMKNDYGDYHPDNEDGWIHEQNRLGYEKKYNLSKIKLDLLHNIRKELVESIDLKIKSFIITRKNHFGSDKNE